MGKQILVRFMAALALVSQWSLAGASALSDAAAALQPGQWVQLSTQNFNPALLDDGDYTVFYYTEDMTWDPVTRQLLFVGGGHDNDAEFLRYNESTNTWSRTKPTGGFWHGNFSHAYDHNAIIPSLGKFYFRQPAFDPSDHIEVYDIPTGVWSRSSAMPDRPGCCGGLEYFPELNGLILANGDAGVLFYDPVANSWQTISGASWGDYHNFAEYSPVHKTMIFGGGESSGTNSVFRMNASRQITRLSNAPQHMGTTHSIVTTDPNSGNHLVFFNSSFYEFNPATDTWRLQSGNAPWGGGVFGTVATPISTYGVVLFAHYTRANDARIYLYRHSPGSGTTVPTVTLSANPTSLPSGATTMLTWSSTDADSCSASGGWSGSRATSGSETSGALTANTTFTLTCTNGQGGSTSRSVTVTVASGTPAPTVNFSASPTSVAVGGSSTLSWTTTNAASCTGSGAWSGSKSVPNGSQSVGPLNAAATYNLSCTGAGGTTQRSVTVSIVAAPTVTFSGNPMTVTAGGRSTLTWSSQNATGCTASGAWAGNKAVSGSEQSPVINATSTFNLTCTGAGGSAGQSVTVAVSTPPAPTLTFSANPTSVPSGGSSTLTWASTNATSCTASGGWTGTKAMSGNQTLNNITANTTYTLRCTGAGGSISRNAQVAVNGSPAAPTVTLVALPLEVSVNGTSMLTWTSTNATSCTASGDWSGARGTAGTESTTPLTDTSTFTMTCSGAGGTSGPEDVTVTVVPGGGGGGGGSTANAESGGGSLDLLLLALGMLLLGVRLVRSRMPLMSRPRVLAAMPAVLVALLATFGAQAADLTSVTVVSTSSGSQSNVPVTFGQVFKAGDVPAGAVIGARNGSTTIPIQVDKKATHGDGSLRHAVLSLVMPSMGANASQVITLTNTGTAPSGGAITPASLLATSFDTTISLDIGGTVYSASARELLAGSPGTWLTGPLATEFLLSGPVRTAGGAAHPHLQARFHVRAYDGLQSVRVEAVLENNWAFETGPRNYSYNLTINVAGRGAVYTQNSVNHYRQSRWRRVVWWGTVPSFTVKHDSAYLMATRAVPTYDTRVQVTTNAMNGWVSGLGTNPGVMSIGALEANMPSPGGRFEIAPLPAFQAGYLLSQDDRARRVTIGYGEQAGAWPMHYRDKATDQAVSLDTNPNMTIIGGSGIFGNFPACGGSCDTNGLLPEASHHPSLVYLPYLITGDYYLMEELVFWGDWVVFYGEAGRHGGSQGLVVWDQVRGQAWALRTLAQAAYATPDSHPLKNYLKQKLQNNITYFVNNWVNSNPLGYMTNTGAAAWLGFPGILSTWMDDFMTWTMGHIVNLGFTEAAPVLAWKAKFPVGRLTDSGMCWTLASTNWVYATHRGYGGDSSDGSFITNWTDWRRNVIYGWDESLRGTNSIGGSEAVLFNASCASSQMLSILGIGNGNMIGWDGPDAYPANLQAAAAAAVEAGAANAQQAFNVLTSRGAYPLNAYGDAPQWAVWPATATASLPAVQISANPTAVTSGQTSTLTWTATNATSCSASGGWAGNKALSGSETTPAIMATTTFTLSCSNASGSSSAAATVTLQSGSAPTLTLTANPTSVMSGGSSTLTWSSTNATACTASGGWSGAKATSGNQTITNITANTTYTLQCTGTGGSISRSAQVTVTASPAPTLTLTANPTSVVSGGSSTLTWTSTNATSCTASGGWTGAKATSGNQTINNITATTTYTLQCTGTGGSISRNAQVMVSATAPPTLTLNANPTTVAPGGNSTLTWSSANTTSCTASGGWTGTKATSGNQTISNITATTTYTLQCTGPGGNISRNAQVTVTNNPPPMPTVDLSANPTSVAVNGSSTLTWTSTNATSCDASDAWSGMRGTSGSESTGALSNTATYSITCTGASGSASDSVTVTVTPGGGGGGGTTESDSGGGSFGWLSVLLLALALVRARGVGFWKSRVVSLTSGLAPLRAATAALGVSALVLAGCGSSSEEPDDSSTPAMPTVALSADPMSVAMGASTVVTWSSTDATSCTGSGDWSGTLGPSGSQTISNITSNKTFSAQCTGPGGTSGMQSVSVTVSSSPAPTATLSANPTTVNSGGSSTLTWSSTNATACTASGGWSGQKATSGNQTITNITATTLYSLQCSGAGGNSPVRNVTVTVNGAPPPPAPTLTFSGNPTTVASGGNSTLTWSSTNASNCTASGAWTGSRPTSGSQNLTNLTATGTYSLQCTGAGGTSPMRNVTITVNAPAAPTLSLSANPATINSGEQSVLTWNSSNATACTASGGWTGTRNLNGNETVGPLTQTTTYTLTCTGTGGSINRNATVTVNGGSESVRGAVDSSYVDRFGDNRIYVFSGTVTPDDMDGDAGDPVTTIPVNQDANACTFRYGGGNLANGTYTIAFTQDAAADVPGQANTLVFVGTRQVTVGSGGVTSDFRPSGILTVGPGRQFATLAAAQAAATNGAVIEIDAGNYTDDVTVWRQNNVTIRGVGGGRAHIVGNRVIPFNGTDRDNGMGLMVIRGTAITVENIEFSGARVADENGAGIRSQGRDLTICNGYHHDNEDGFLGEATGTLLVEYSEFSFNGECPPGGCNHNLYIDGGDRLIFRHNYSHHAIIGHTLKTRAAENYILYNRLMDEDTGSSSYNIDVPNGGLTFVIGNLIQQGPNTDNSQMLAYGLEGLSGGRTHELYIVNNTFVNDMGSGGFASVQGGTSLVRTINNLFVGPGSIPSGTQNNNLRTDSPGLVNRAGFDYHLTSSSAAVNAGAAPGSARGQDLTPIYQYVHKAMREARPVNGMIDIGAYEFPP